MAGRLVQPESGLDTREHRVTEEGGTRLACRVLLDVDRGVRAARAQFPVRQSMSAWIADAKPSTPTSPSWRAADAN